MYVWSTRQPVEQSLNAQSEDKYVIYKFEVIKVLEDCSVLQGKKKSNNPVITQQFLRT